MSGEAPSPRALLREAERRLAAAGIEDARLEAELLLAAAIGVPRLEFQLQPERPLEPAQVDAFQAALRRRLRREPLQYIAGVVHFRELVLRVDPRVLIPRPETEVLVGAVLAWARQRLDAATRRRGGSAVARGGPAASWRRPREAGRADTATSGPGLTALDIGTGSGAIALSLLKEGPFRHVVATDVSGAALAVAEENARRVGVRDRLELRRGPLWDPVAKNERFDVVVSNPPYVAERERDELAAEVRDWEPAVALFAAEEGRAVLHGLVAGAAQHLAGRGLLALEVGLGQATDVAALLRQSGYPDVRVVQDLAGRDRIVLAEARASAA